MKRTLLAPFLMLLAATVAFAQPERPTYTISVTRGGVPLGNIVIETFPDLTPKHAANFDSLVSVGFYNGTAFHRVIPGFMIQGGDPNSKSEPRQLWGRGAPGQRTVPAEFGAMSHTRGVISAARTNDPNSATSQFFICVAAPTFLDGKYSAFGRVLEGMAVADTIVAQPRDENDNPLEKIEMNIVRTVKSTPRRGATGQTVTSTPRARTASSSNDTITTKSGLKYVITHKGSGRKAANGNVVVAHYTGTLRDGSVFGTSRGGEPLAFTLGKKQVIKGWDEAFTKLRIGDRATLIIPPALGYAARTDRPTIPPNSTLIFDVELVDLKEKQLGDLLNGIIKKNGVQSAIAAYRKQKANGFKGYHVDESQLNNIGYALLKDGKWHEAVEFFKLNVEAYPNSGNVYDSLGEGYMKIGENALAIANYRRSLELDPKNGNAKEKLLELGVQP